MSRQYRPEHRIPCQRGTGRNCDSALGSGSFYNRLSFRLPRRNSAMGQGLGPAAVSEARASACVSTYSRTFVNLPF